MDLLLHEKQFTGSWAWDKFYKYVINLLTILDEVHFKFCLYCLCVNVCVCVLMTDQGNLKREIFCKPSKWECMFYLFIIVFFFFFFQVSRPCKDLLHSNLSPVWFSQWPLALICKWGLKSPHSSSHNCPFRGFAFSRSLSSFRQMSVFRH